jgi:hypothetical protein
MYPPRLHASLSFTVVLVALCVFSGCGGCDGTSTTNNGAGDAEGDTATMDAVDDSQPDDTDDTSSTDTDGDSDDDTDAEECAAADQCGTECCASGELCLREACVTPGADCENNIQCPNNEVCEPTLGKCIPDLGDTCEYRPGEQVFDPSVELAWRDDANTPLPQYNQVMMTPSVVDIDENGSPDILFSTFTGSNYNQGSVLRAVDGETYDPIFDLTDSSKLVSGSASLAVGDIDSDGRNEIVAVQPAAPSDSARGIFALDDHTTGWAKMWTTSAFSMSWDGAYLVDLNADTKVEVVASNRVYDGTTGDLLCVADGVSASASNSSAANLDGTGNLEVITGSGAFKFEADGQGGFNCPAYWTQPAGGGYPALADFGTFDGAQPQYGVPDSKPEIVTVNTGASDQVQLRSGQDGSLIWSKTLPVDGHPLFTAAQCDGKNGGGPPTVADFDGDGVPEIATAGACFYVVYDTDGTLLWKHPSQDFSSRVTGSSVFDFQGDGKAEVVYADECFIRVYDGAGNGDGTTDVLFKRAHTSGTTRELPVVVDVDSDFHAEIVLISNDYSGVGNTCAANWSDFNALGGQERGILVIEDSQNRWVATRPVWNQHAYHVTNVCDGVDPNLCQGRANRPGAIPVQRPENWELSYLNNFRQNVQGEGLFNAPDLAVTNLKTGCNGDTVDLEITVGNLGSRGVRAGVDVSVYVTESGTEQHLVTLQTTQDLPPGGRETLAYQWADAPDLQGADITVRAVADEDADGNQQHNECVEDNNEIVDEASCICEDFSDCQPGEFCNSSGECVPIGG